MDIIRFKYCDYELALRMDPFGLVYVKIKDNNVNYAVSFKEKLLIDYVLKQIKPQGKILYKKTFRYKEKNYIHFLSQNNLNLIYEIDNNVLKEPDDNTKAYFNYLYNNQNEYVASNNKEKEPTFKRIIKIGTLSLVAVVSATIIFSYNYLEKAQIRKQDSSDLNESIVSSDEDLNYLAISPEEEKTLTEIFKNNPNLWNKELTYHFNDTDLFLYYDKDSEQLTIKKLENKKVDQSDLSVDEIIALINNNPNLSKKEKALFLSNTDFFNDNLAYFDQALVRETLKNLKIVYDPNPSLDKNDAEYYSDTKTCIIYNSTELNDNNICYLLHEFLHTFTNVANLKNGIAFYECLNALATNEYYQGNYNSYNILDSSYSWIMPEARMLCELLDKNTIKNFYFTCDDQVIVDALTKIIPDEEMARDLLRNIDILNNIYSNYDYDLEQITMQEIRETIKKYYEIKSNKSIIENEEMMFWWNNEDFIRSIAPSILNDKLAIEFAPYYNYIANYKHYFYNPDGADETKIALCTGVKVIEEPVSLEELIECGVVVKKDGKYVILDNSYVQMKDDGSYVTFSYSALDSYVEYDLKNDNLEYGAR